MSVSKLPSGRWRAQVWDASVHRNVSVSKVLGGPGTFRTQKEAKAARAKARERLEAGGGPGQLTVRDFRERWLTDPLFARPKQSTMLHNAERTDGFSRKFGDVPIALVSDMHVATWIKGGANVSTIPALRAMFNDAGSAAAGRLVQGNPFAGLKLRRGPGNRDKQPPTQQQTAQMVALARELTPPSFAAYLEFAGVTAIRPGELDALRWSRIDLKASEIHVVEQWSVKVRTFTPPKYGPYTAALVGRAREVLVGMPRAEGEDDFVFTTIRGTHYTPSSRTHHWNRVRAAAGLGDMSLYLATRHYFGWYALNILELAPHVVAEQLGHKDGGKLVVQLYGHPDKARARRLIREAHDSAARITPLRVVREDAS